MLTKITERLLTWAWPRLAGLRAAYIPGPRNQVADFLSRQSLQPGEWRLHPEVVSMIWRSFGRAQVDLFASREATHWRTIRARWARMRWRTTGRMFFCVRSLRYPSFFRPFTGSSRRGTIFFWWPPSGRGGPGSHYCDGCVIARQCASPAGQTCCHKWGASCFIPTPVASSYGFGLYGAWARPFAP